MRTFCADVGEKEDAAEQRDLVLDGGPGRAAGSLLLCFGAVAGACLVPEGGGTKDELDGCGAGLLGVPAVSRVD